MYEWNRTIQRMVVEIDECIKEKSDEQISMKLMAEKFGYSEYHFSRKFKEISGMQFRDYLRFRKLAFALKQ